MRRFPPDLCTAQPVRSAKYAPLPCVVPDELSAEVNRRSFQPSGDGMKPASPSTCGALSGPSERRQLAARRSSSAGLSRSGVGGAARPRPRPARAPRPRWLRMDLTSSGGAGNSRRTAHASRGGSNVLRAPSVSASETRAKTATRGSAMSAAQSADERSIAEKKLIRCERTCERCLPTLGTYANLPSPRPSPQTSPRRPRRRTGSWRA